jgi:predicted transcriptional regulator
MARRAHVGSQRGLGRRRRMVGLTQHDVAQATGIPVGRIVFAETGRIDLEPAEVEKVETCLKKRARKAMEAVA